MNRFRVWVGVVVVLLSQGCGAPGYPQGPPYYNTQGSGGSVVSQPSASFCSPLSTSAASNRGALRVSNLQLSGTNGTFSVSYDSDNRPTYIRFTANDSRYSYTDSLTWNSTGQLVFFRHDGSMDDSDYSESFTYDSQGQLTFYRFDAAISGADFTESFTYDGRRQLIFFRHDGEASGADFSESFTYDSNGRLTYWRRDAENDGGDATLSITYDARGNITYSQFQGANAYKGNVNRCGSTAT